MMTLTENERRHGLLGHLPLHGLNLSRSAEQGAPVAVQPIERGAGGPTVAYYSAASVTARGPHVLDFTDGSFWIVGTQLDPTLASDSFVGIAYSAATLVIPPEPPPGPPFDRAPLAGAIVIPDDITASLTVHPTTITPPTGPIDNDGSAATITPPAQARFELAPDGAALVLLGDAAATVYDTTINFSGGASGMRSDPDRNEWVASFATVTPTPINLASPGSKVFVTNGTAVPSAGEWRLPIIRTTPDQLSPAAEGTFGVAAGSNVSVTWDGHPAVRLNQFDLEVRTGFLRLTAPATGGQPFVDTYQLWDAGTPAHARPTSIAVSGRGSGTIVSTQSAAQDVVEFSGCTLAAHIDRPCLLDGTQPQFAHLVADYFVGIDATGRAFALIGSAPPTTQNPPPESYLLENAVLTTGGIDALVLSARLTGSTASEGKLHFAAQLSALTPTLPDPYAALVVDVTQEPRHLECAIEWSDATGVAMTLELGPGTALVRRSSPADPLTSTTLYDVSGASDQLGVSIVPDVLAVAQISGQTLTVTGDASALFALPGVAWEPAAAVDALGDHVVFPAFAADDGPSVAINVATQELRPMTPDAFITQFLADYAAGSDLTATFSLPFGLAAEVETVATTPPSPAVRPTLELEPADFGEVTGGRQLSVGAPQNPFVRGILPGTSQTASTIDLNSGQPYAPEIIDPSIAAFWNDDFTKPTGGDAPFVPLSRVALSGYGTSIFSDYANSRTIGVTEARFDVVVGRANYTLVEVRSQLGPWRCPVVNSTIFQRDAGGWVQRFNTGWQSQGSGAFALGEAEPGGYRRILNVRNIVDQHLPLVSAAGKDWLQVSFDADVALVTDATDPNGLQITGGDIGDGIVAGHGFTGWIEIPTDAPGSSIDHVPTLDDLLALMDVVHTASGAITADVVVGAAGSGTGATPGINMTLTGVDVSAATDTFGDRFLVVALRGLPHLPRDGSWSMARRTQSLAPQPIDPLTPVPLVRASSDPASWHLAEPADVLDVENAATRYSIVQSTGTQQMFFEQPKIAAGQNPLTFLEDPALADVGALLGSDGLLPDLASLLHFAGFSGFSPVDDGLGATQDLTQTLQLPDTTLIPLGPITVLLGTNLDADLPPSQGTPPGESVVTVVIDPGATQRWSVSLTNIAFKLAIDGMGGTADPVVAVVGDFAAADGQKPTLTNLQFGYGQSLSTVKDILSGIEALRDALPGGGVSGLDVAFTGSKLRVRDAVSLPQLPLGPGYIEGIALDVGFELDVIAKTMSFTVGLGTDQDPFTWLASPLAGNGLLQLGAGDGGTNVRLQAGLGVGLGIDVGIASGSASVCLAAQIDTNALPFGLTVLLTGSASVDVLDGLASTSLTLTAGLTVDAQVDLSLLKPPPDIDRYKKFIETTTVTLAAEVAVAIHLTVGWFVHVDWDGSWGLSETVSGAALTSLLP